MKRILAIAVVALGFGALAVACGSKNTAANADSATPTAANAGSAKVVEVKVDESGFTPSTITVRARQGATLRFLRTSDETCAEKVVFPELKLEKVLPLNQAVDVAIPTDSPRTLAFQCGMGMYKSTVVVQ